MNDFRDGWDDSVLNACRNIRTPQINAALLRLARETLTPSFASDFLVESLANVITVDLAGYLRSALVEAPKAKGSLAPWQMRRIAEHVEESPGTSLSITLLAELCRISSGHLMRAFKQTAGETVHSYVERAAFRSPFAGRREVPRPAFANSCIRRPPSRRGQKRTSF